jgi:hypothetical protein
MSVSPRGGRHEDSDVSDSSRPVVVRRCATRLRPEPCYCCAVCVSSFFSPLWQDCGQSAWPNVWATHNPSSLLSSGVAIPGRWCCWVVILSAAKSTKSSRRLQWYRDLDFQMLPSSSQKVGRFEDCGCAWRRRACLYPSSLEANCSTSTDNAQQLQSFATDGRVGASRADDT